MAKKHLNPLEDPPTASSSEDEEVETSGGEEEEDEEQKSDSSSEEENSKKPPQIPSGKKLEAPPAVTIAVPGRTPTSNSDSGSETETDSDSETDKKERVTTNPGSVKTITILNSKPKKEIRSTDEPSPSPALALPAAKSAGKRPSQEGNPTDVNAKRAKNVSGDDEKKIGEDPKKPYFQRLWSEDDEIAVLQGMIDFKTEIGKSPYEDMNGFYKFVKKSISFDVSKNQFMDKIRSLKKKYLKKNGEEPSFSKPHDHKSFSLSKHIWGSEGMGLESVVKSNGKAKKSQKSKAKKLDSVKQELYPSPNGKKLDDDRILMIEGGTASAFTQTDVKKPDWFENSFLVRSISGFGVDEYSVKERWSMVADETKKKLEEKWKVLQAKEFEFAVQKTELLHEVTGVIVEASKNKPSNI